MPKANIERSIKRGTGELGGAAIEEYMFEGYGPGGIGIIVEAASDNKNRISSDVRTAFGKNGGNLAASGAVAFQFSRKGVIRVKPGVDPEMTLLSVLDAGAEDAIEEENEIIVYTPMKDLNKVRTAISDEGIEVVEAQLDYVPKTTMMIEDKNQAAKAIRLMEAIEDIEDVTNTYSNFDIVEG